MAKKDELKQLEEKLASAEDQLKRAVADYRNLEKRIQEDALSVAQYSRGQMVSKILPALDSLDQAVAGAGTAEQDSAWLKGVMMAIKQLRQALAEEGLVEIEASGQFDPALHEAVDVHEGEDGKILEVALRGYTLGGRVLRPTKVIVGKSESGSGNKELKEEVQTE